MIICTMGVAIFGAYGGHAAVHTVSLKPFIDGKPVGSLRSEGIAHATKNKIGLVTPGQEMLYDNVVVKVP